jgi:CxxC motif-containing protein
MKKQFTCIVCPVSCNLEVEEKEGILKVNGNQCKRGLNFADREFRNPHRMLTTTVKVTGSSVRRVPVISSDEVPKERMFELVNMLYKISLKSPVQRGQIVAMNIGNTGVDIIATRTIKNDNKRD